MNWREMLTHNLGLKTLSLLLAAVLWLFVAAERETEIGASVAVGFKNVAPGLAIVNRPPSRLDVRLAGPKVLLLRLRAENLSVLLDLQGAGGGTTSFTGLEKEIPLPAGVRVTRVTPAVIEVKLASPGP